MTSSKTPAKGSADGAGSILSTVGGPSDPTPPESLGAVPPESERLLDKVQRDAELAAACRSMRSSRPEYGDAARSPAPRRDPPARTRRSPPPAPAPRISSRKLGEGAPDIGENPLNGPLDRVRVDPTRGAS
jgi:catalase